MLSRRVASLFLTIAAAAIAPAADAQPAEDVKRVLVLYTTRPDAQITIVGERELPRILEDGLGASIDYYPEYIDPARFPDRLYQDGLRDFLRVKYRGVSFDVVIAIHDAAVDFIGRNRSDLFGDAPVVYLSNSARTTAPRNATGIVAPLDFGSTLALAAELQPDLRRIYVVLGTSRADQMYGGAARAQFRAWEPRLQFTYLTGLGLDELGSQLPKLPAGSAVYYVLANEDRAGRHFHPLDYLEHVTAAASVPTYSWVDSAMNRGIVGGNLRLQQRQIEALGGLALRVLRGERADAIPVSVLDAHTREVDWLQLRRWGISEARVPPGVIVLNREVSVWERYRALILFAVALLLAQSALIAALLFQRSQRRRAEAQVRGSEAALRESYDQIRNLGTRLLNEQEAERQRQRAHRQGEIDDAQRQHQHLIQQRRPGARVAQHVAHALQPGAIAIAVGITRTARHALAQHHLHQSSLDQRQHPRQT